MEEVEAIDYEAEARLFRQKLLQAENDLRRHLANFETDFFTTCQNLRSKTLNTLEERRKVKQRIEELRQAIHKCEVDQEKEKEEAERLKREMEEIIIAQQREDEELEGQKEILAEYTENIKKEEVMASEAKQKNQRKMSQAESSIQLFKANLGLDITCVRNDTFIFRFTQVSHSHPEAEYWLKMSLEEDIYRLIESEPPLPSLPQLQEELNASGNLTACIFQIRKLYQRMDIKRPRE